MDAFLLSLALLSSSELKLRSERPLLVSFFQEDCEVCRRQFKEFDCLEKSGLHIQVVGVGDDKAKLKKLSRKLSGGARDVSSVISRQEAKALGLRGTPAAFLMREGSDAQKILGLYACELKEGNAAGPVGGPRDTWREPRFDL